MGTPLLQPSFTGGELAPSLYARVDLVRYGNSLRTCKNFLIRPWGGVANRPGFGYVAEVADSTDRVRLIPFIYSTEVGYVIEVGDEYMRFFANGAPVLDGGSPVEIATPWGISDIAELRFTQSADVMTFTHPRYPPQQLSRTSSTTFVLAPYEGREGPFRDLNSDEAVFVSASAQTGNVTVTSNSAIFTADMVGSLFYMEQKELTQIPPWTQGERGITVGTLRRSDGKTYRASNVPSSTDWTESGSFRPTHEAGRAWDGGGDERTNGSQTWRVGIEWEYQDSGYGIVQLTEFTSATQMDGLVVRQLPAAVVGGLGSVVGTWTFSGDGVDVQFSVTGAVSPVQSDYVVTIDGVPVQSNPFYSVQPFTSGAPGTPRPQGTQFTRER